jgi:hypothetical protein
MAHQEQPGSALEPPAWETARAYAKRKMDNGTPFFAIGLTISVVTYIVASQNPLGGSYLVAWGPVSSERSPSFAASARCEPHTREPWRLDRPTPSTTQVSAEIRTRCEVGTGLAAESMQSPRGRV